MTQTRVFTVLRYAIGAFFVLSGIGKIIDSSVAEKAISYITTDFHAMLPQNPRVLVLGFSVVEILVGGLLLANRFVSLAVMASCALLLAFSIPLAETVIKGLDVPACGCSGVFDLGMSLRVALARNLVLYALLMWMALYLQRTGAGFQGLFTKRA